MIDIDIADAINGYFGAGSAVQATQFIAKADASYPDPRYGMSTEDRRKDMIAALFSSIVSAKVDHNDLAHMLDVLSKADMMVGRANARREWRLLKYVSTIIAAGLYERSRQKGIKYTQYSMPWPLMGPIFARSQSTRKILGKLAPALHTSRSSAGSFAYPYFIRLLIEEKVDPIEFAADNFGDESVGESIAKEIEKAKKR
jgi:replication factor C large subunit